MRHGDPRHAADDAFAHGRDGAGMMDVGAQIAAGIDSGQRPNPTSAQDDASASRTQSTGVPATAIWSAVGRLTRIGP